MPALTEAGLKAAELAVFSSAAVVTIAFAGCFLFLLVAAAFQR